MVLFWMVSELPQQTKMPPPSPFAWLPETVLFKRVSEAVQHMSMPPPVPPLAPFRIVTFLIVTPPVALSGREYEGQLLCRAHRYEIAAAWLAGYATGLRHGGRV